MTETAIENNTQEPLSLDQAKDLIREKFNLIVDENDPVMLSVLLEQAFHNIRENQFQAHMTELTKVVENSSVRCVEAVNESIKLLKDEALKGSLENTLAMVSQKAKENGTLIQKMRSFSRSVWIATALVWLAITAMFFILK